MTTAAKKQQIIEAMGAMKARLGSQNKMANALAISAATVSDLLNSKWELISDEMWNQLAAKLKLTDSHWVAVETGDFKIMNQLLTDAKDNSNVYALTGSAGTGKSFALRHFAESKQNAFLLCCNEFWNRKQFLIELLHVMGRDSSGLTVNEMMFEIVKSLRSKSNPIIIMDEADKLTDQVLYFFITIYNQLEDQCGIILAATDHLEKRIKKGLRLNKKGYNEIYSRIGRKFIELRGVSHTDIHSIAMANGIESRTQIKELQQDSEGDLRRVKRKIHAFKMINKTAAN